MVKNNINFLMHYNIHEFYLNILKGNNIEIVSGSYNIQIDRTKDLNMSWEDWSRKVLWYGHRSGNYLYSFSPSKKI